MMNHAKPRTELVREFLSMASPRIWSPSSIARVMAASGWGNPGRDAASTVLRELAASGAAKKQGSGRNTRYVIGDTRYIGALGDLRPVRKFVRRTRICPKCGNLQNHKHCDNCPITDTVPLVILTIPLKLAVQIVGYYKDGSACVRHQDGSIDSATQDELTVIEGPYPIRTMSYIFSGRIVTDR